MHYNPLIVGELLRGQNFYLYLEPASEAQSDACPT